jgi:molybdopterin synthase catalytic subunit
MSGDDRVALVEAPIVVDDVVARVRRPGAGGIAVFLGVVRDEAEGRAVTLLEYEAYRPMAIAEMSRCIADVEASDVTLRLAVTHRIGALQVGDIAVVCAASAPHRGEAFRGSRALIDAIKARVPIWKREHGPDGAYWVGWRDARCDEAVHTHDHAHTHEHADDPHKDAGTK